MVWLVVDGYAGVLFAVWLVVTGALVGVACMQWAAAPPPREVSLPPPLEAALAAWGRRLAARGAPPLGPDGRPLARPPRFRLRLPGGQGRAARARLEGAEILRKRAGGRWTAACRVALLDAADHVRGHALLVVAHLAERSLFAADSDELLLWAERELRQVCRQHPVFDIPPPAPAPSSSSCS